jgi:hypothetical protein
MKRNNKYIFLSAATFILVLLFSACKKEKSEAPKMYFNYFGLTPGRYVMYDVLEVEHDVNLIIPHDTSRYQLKTFIGGIYTDNFGREAREFKRYKRNTSSDPWVLADLWTAIIEDYKAELVEENQRVIKLVFAPTTDKTWNPNAFNSNEVTESYYENIHSAATLNGVSYDSILTVRQGYFKSLIDYQNKSEVYATNIGLISKSYKNLKIAGFDTLNVKKGNEIHYKCIGFGFE